MSGGRQRGAVGYYASADVLTPELTALALDALGVARKVTFGEGGSAFTKSENLLPENLVWRIRDHLDKFDLTHRTVFISKYLQREVPRHLAYTISKFMVGEGSTVSAAADTVAYHVNSLAVWGIKRFDHTSPTFQADAETLVKYMAEGREHCATLGGRERDDHANHFAWVGWGRSWVRHHLHRMGEIAKDMAAFGGPAVAFVALYQAPPLRVSELAPWSQHPAPTPPGTKPEQDEWWVRGRAYCVQYNRPIHTRHYPWVGWLLDRTKNEMLLAPGVKASELARG